MFFALQASPHKARVHRQCYQTKTETNGTVCAFCIILVLNWSVLACSHATPNLGMRLIWVGFHSLYIQGDCYGVFWYIRLSSGWTDIHTGLYAVLLTAGHGAGHGAVDSWCFMSIPQLKEEMEIDRNTAGQWSVLLGLAWAGSVCYHGNEQGVCVTMAMKCTLVF